MDKQTPLKNIYYIRLIFFLVIIGITACMIRIFLFNRYHNIDDNSMQLNHIDTCKASTYQIFRPSCCIVQFAKTYLYSMGFTEIYEFDHIIDPQIPESSVLMINNKINKIGCYGLKIQQRNYSYSQHIAILKKTELYSCTMDYCNKYGLKQCKTFLPETYDLRMKHDRINFFKLIPCDNKPNFEWVLKTNKHRATGIKFINDSNYFRKFYLTTKEQMISNPLCFVRDPFTNSENLRYNQKDPVIAQKWINNALKINGCKFHIRSYIVLANYANPLIVLYADSVIFKATNPLQMFSNHAVSMQNEDFDDDKDEWMWNMEEFGDYFELIDLDRLVAKIQKITKILFLASFSQYNFTEKSNNQYQYYSLIAIDLLITSDLEIKVMELNDCPSTSSIPKYCDYQMMQTNRNCIMGKQMMQEIVDIQIEIAIKKLNQQKIETLQAIKHFKPIIFQ